MPAILVDHLTKRYRFHRKDLGVAGSMRALLNRKYEEKSAIKELSFQIEDGEFVGFIGPNGAGKTTTMKILSGILFPTSGVARVLGFVPWQRQTIYQRQISLVMGQKSQLIWDLPPSETFGINKEIYGLSNQAFRTMVSKLSQILEVEHLLNIQTRKLSLGERMKMELIAALLHNPRVLFLDEPTIGLDLTAQINIREFLAEHNKSFGATILLTSHYLGDIKELCKRVIIINTGELMYDGDFDGLAQRLSLHKHVAITFESQPCDDDLKSFGTISSKDNGRVVLRVERDRIPSTVEQILRTFSIRDLNVEETPIEELIADIYGGKVII